MEKPCHSNMKRRDFIQKGTLGGSFLAFGGAQAFSLKAKEGRALWSGVLKVNVPTPALIVTSTEKSFFIVQTVSSL